MHTHHLPQQATPINHRCALNDALAAALVDGNFAHKRISRHIGHLCGSRLHGQLLLQAQQFAQCSVFSHQQIGALRLERLLRNLQRRLFFGLLGRFHRRNVRTHQIHRFDRLGTEPLKRLQHCGNTRAHAVAHTPAAIHHHQHQRSNRNQPHSCRGWQAAPKHRWGLAFKRVQRHGPSGKARPCRWDDRKKKKTRKTGGAALIRW